MTDKPQPVVILVRPQLGTNIGMCARAMLNCGLRRLRLVSPRDGWPQDEARAAAADADLVLDQAEVFSTLDEAVADCRRVFATTARDRSMAQPVKAVEEAAVEIVGLESGQDCVAVLFGPEASGLDGDSISRSDTLLRFPTNPDFASLNLAQAVLLFGWEWRRVSESTDGTIRSEEPAPREKLDHFLERLYGELETANYFLTEEMRPHTERSLRALFTRTNATERELQMLQGMLTALREDGRQT